MPTGQVTGFLGPNGAGKSTTIRILLGLLRATAGARRCSGATRGRTRSSLHRRIAYVPGDVTLWPNLTGGQAIDILGAAAAPLDPARKQADARALRARPDEEGAHLLEGQPAEGRTSRGARSRAELLILDEPTSGLDPLMEAAFTESSRR